MEFPDSINTEQKNLLNKIFPSQYDESDYVDAEPVALLPFKDQDLDEEHEGNSPSNNIQCAQQ